MEDALEPPPRTNGSASVLTQKMEGLTMTPPSALPPHHMAAASPHGPLTVQTAGPPLTPGGPAYPGHYAPHHLLPPSAFASAGPALQVQNLPSSIFCLTKLSFPGSCHYVYGTRSDTCSSCHGWKFGCRRETTSISSSAKLPTHPVWFTSTPACWSSPAASAGRPPSAAPASPATCRPQAGRFLPSHSARNEEYGRYVNH